MRYSDIFCPLFFSLLSIHQVLGDISTYDKFHLPSGETIKALFYDGFSTDLYITGSITTSNCDIVQRYDLNGNLIWKYVNLNCTTRMFFNAILPAYSNVYLPGYTLDINGTENFAITVLSEFVDGNNVTTAEFEGTCFSVFASPPTPSPSRGIAISDQTYPFTIIYEQNQTVMLNQIEFESTTDITQFYGASKPSSVGNRYIPDTLIANVIGDTLVDTVLVGQSLSGSIMAERYVSGLRQYNSIISNNPNDIATNITLDGSTEFSFVIGYTESALAPGAVRQGLGDGFVLCLNSTGSIIWGNQWGVSGKYSKATSIAIVGQKIVVGTTVDTDAFFKVFMIQNGAEVQTMPMTGYSAINHIIPLITLSGDSYQGVGMGQAADNSYRVFNFTLTPPPPPPSPPSTQTAFENFIKSPAAIIGGAVLGSLIFCCGFVSFVIWWLSKRIAINKAKALAFNSKDAERKDSETGLTKATASVENDNVGSNDFSDPIGGTEKVEMTEVSGNII